MLFAGSENFLPILVGYIYIFISIDTIFINMSIFDECFGRYAHHVIIVTIHVFYVI